MTQVTLELPDTKEEAVAMGGKVIDVYDGARMDMPTKFRTVFGKA